MIEGPLARGENSLQIWDVLIDWVWQFHLKSFDLCHKTLLITKAIPICWVSTGKEDKLSWSSSLNGFFLFTKCLFYSCWYSYAHFTSAVFWMWKIQALPKQHLFFFLKSFLCSLLVKSILAGRGFQGVPCCDFSLNPNETIIHVLRDCVVAKGFWLDVDCGSFNTSFFSLDVNSWLHTNATSEALMPSLGASWGIFFLFGTWKLWFQRNKKKKSSSSRIPAISFADKLIRLLLSSLIVGFG